MSIEKWNKKKKIYKYKALQPFIVFNRRTINTVSQDSLSQFFSYYLVI